MEHALMDLLESGDIDAIRRRLKKVEQGAKKEWLAGDQEAARKILSSDWTQVDDDDTADKRPAVKKIVPKKPAPSLFSDRPLLKLSIGDYTLSLRSYRTMGKLLWPAGHAVALMLAQLSDSPEPVGLVEIGAGAAVPSLIAAAGHIFSRGVVATDFVEENVELIKHNDELNGTKIMSAELLDVGEGLAEQMASVSEWAAQHLARAADDLGLRALVERRFGLSGYVLIIVADMSYDPEAITNIFASASDLLAYDDVEPIVLFARSDNFAHLDTNQTEAAEQHGFALAATTDTTAAGVQDAVAESHLTPCAEDRVKAYWWMRPRVEAPMTDDPVVEWLLAGASRAASAAAESSSSSRKEALPAVAEEEEEAAKEDIWAPKRVSTYFSPEAVAAREARAAAREAGAKEAQDRVDEATAKAKEAIARYEATKAMALKEMEGLGQSSASTQMLLDRISARLNLSAVPSPAPSSSASVTGGAENLLQLAGLRGDGTSGAASPAPSWLVEAETEVRRTSGAFLELS